MKVTIQRRAAEEARAAREWYDERSSAAAAGFVDQLRLGFERIGEMPEAWPPYIHNTRRYLLSGYPYQIVYRIRGDNASVLAIAHTARRPGYWRKR